MGTEAIDRTLREWEDRLRRVDESLLALEAEPTYQMLAPAAVTRAPLDGETKRRVEPALEELANLFEHRSRLTEVLDRAKEVREGMSSIAFWGNDEKEREIQALLFGPSIELPPEATPLARRSLLDPGSRDVRVVPEQLLAAMAAAYERARDAVVAVKAAWERVEPALAALEARVDEARAAAASLGLEEAARPELDGAARELQAARVRVARDPLGATGDVDANLGPRIAAVTGRLAELAAQRDRVTDGVARGRARLEELRAAHAEARRAAERLPLEVEGARAPAAPASDALIEGLAPWLDKIEATAGAGRWSSAEVGLTRWREAADAYLATDGAITGALAAVLAKRDELAGRLAARRAQAASLAARGVALDAAAEHAARDADKLLAKRPTPLARAVELVDRYEAAVRSSTKKK
jgi:hypothetical protein